MRSTEKRTIYKPEDEYRQEVRHRSADIYLGLFYDESGGRDEPGIKSRKKGGKDGGKNSRRNGKKNSSKNGKKNGSKNGKKDGKKDGKKNGSKNVRKNGS